MSKLARHRREELISRLIYIGVVFGIVCFLGFLGWRLWRSGQGTERFIPKELSLVDRPDYKRVDAQCYEFYIPTDFELMQNLDCQLNAYARPRKHSYFQVSPYYDVQDEAAMIEKWRERWLTLGATERSRDRVVIGGRTAWRMEDFYSQNNESFVSYLVFLDQPIRVDGRDAITAFELRAWATSEADRALAAEIIQDWQWRF